MEPSWMEMTVCSSKRTLAVMLCCGVAYVEHAGWIELRISNQHEHRLMWRERKAEVEERDCSVPIGALC